MQSFEEILSSIVASAVASPRQLAEGECQSSSGLRCRLCHAVNLDYQSEVPLKNNAVKQFWKSLRLPIPIDPLITSPLGRKYRTISKRRVFAMRDTTRLGLINPNEAGDLKPFSVVQCDIEPDDHGKIYEQIQTSIVKPYAKSLAKNLSYVVIKGNYREQTIIFNVEDISADVVRSANTLSKSLTKKFESVVGLFLYEDKTSPQYYMGAKNQNKLPKFKKLFGKPEIFQRVKGKGFLYSPLSFSQVNQSIVEKMVQTAEALLGLTSNAKLYDLYCGYGLFSLCLSGGVHSVIGAEVSPSSIESAMANAKRQKVTNARFIRSDINEESIERIMTNAGPDDAVILDPPRKGTPSGVLECIAAKQPRRILHIFCEIDLIAKELKRWGKNGYKPTRAIPFDMFPGTAKVETMILLERA